MGLGDIAGQQEQSPLPLASLECQYGMTLKTGCACGRWLVVVSHRGVKDGDLICARVIS